MYSQERIYLSDTMYYRRVSRYLHLKSIPRCCYSVDVSVGSIAVSRCRIVLVLDLIMHARIEVIQYLTASTSLHIIMILV